MVPKSGAPGFLTFGSRQLESGKGDLEITTQKGVWRRMVIIAYKLPVQSQCSI